MQRGRPTKPIQSPAPLAERDEHETRIPCDGCGYEVDGLPADGRCPECGLSVSESRHDDRMPTASTADLERLRTGVRRMQWAALSPIAAIAALVGISVMARILELISLAELSSRIEESGGSLAKIALVAGTAMAIVGGRGLATRIDERDDEPDHRRARRTILVAPLIVVPLLGSLWFSVPEFGRIAALFVGCIAAGLTLTAAEFRASWLAVRLGEPRRRSEVRHEGRQNVIFVLVLAILLASFGLTDNSSLPELVRGGVVLAAFIASIIAIPTAIGIHARLGTLGTRLDERLVGPRA